MSKAPTSNGLSPSASVFTTDNPFQKSSKGKLSKSKSPITAPPPSRAASPPIQRIQDGLAQITARQQRNIEELDRVFANVRDTRQRMGQANHCLRSDCSSLTPANFESDSSSCTADEWTQINGRLERTDADITYFFKHLKGLLAEDAKLFADLQQAALASFSPAFIPPIPTIDNTTTPSSSSSPAPTSGPPSAPIGNKTVTPANKTTTFIQNKNIQAHENNAQFLVLTDQHKSTPQPQPQPLTSTSTSTSTAPSHSTSSSTPHPSLSAGARPSANRFRNRVVVTSDFLSKWGTLKSKSSSPSWSWAPPPPYRDRKRVAIPANRATTMDKNSQAQAKTQSSSSISQSLDQFAHELRGWEPQDTNTNVGTTQYGLLQKKKTGKEKCARFLRVLFFIFICVCMAFGIMRMDVDWRLAFYRLSVFLGDVKEVAGRVLGEVSRVMGEVLRVVREVLGEVLREVLMRVLNGVRVGKEIICWACDLSGVGGAGSK